MWKRIMKIPQKDFPPNYFSIYRNFVFFSEKFKNIFKKKKMENAWKIEENSRFTMHFAFFFLSEKIQIFGIFFF